MDESGTLVHIMREHENEATQGQEQGSVARIFQKMLERGFGFSADEQEAIDDLLVKESEKLQDAQIPSTEPERGVSAPGVRYIA